MFEFLERLYIYHLYAAVEVDGNDAQVAHHRVCGVRSYLLYLFGTSIFVEKSAYYVHVIHLRYFIDLEKIHEYN